MEVFAFMPSAVRDAELSPIRFSAELLTLEGATILTLPKTASEQLPSRGQVAVRAMVDGHEFETVVEPDGRRGHWIRVEDAVQKAVGVTAGDSVEVALDVLSDWPEPDVPQDLAAALADAPPRIREVWDGITPMARWEWVRWVQATKNPETRHRRVIASISKMDSGKRRPCCFDLSSCTDPDLGRSGKLRDPSD